MAGFLDGIANSVKNGFATAQQTYTDWLMEKRPTNNERPRIQSTDPTQAIDTDTPISLLSFPTDRPKYFITFGFEEYKRPNQFEGLSSNGIVDYVCLPIPQNLQDNNHFNYSPQEGDIVLEALAKAGVADAVNQSILSGSIDPLKNMATGDTVAGVGGAAMGIGIQKSLDLARSAENLAFSSKGKYVDGALQMGGLADNPFNTIAFGGPNFKAHQFSWMLAPKTRAESEVMRKIIYTFKKAAHPELLTMAAGGFFKYPKIVWPKFQPDTLQRNLYTFKPCVIVDVNIDYTPSGAVGFFAGTEAPIRAVLTLSLLEIEIWRNGAGDQPSDIASRITGGDFNDPTVPNPPIRDLGQF